MPLSKYARKEMMRVVARDFSDSDWQWLSTQSEFIKASQELCFSTHLLVLGKDLIARRSQPMDRGLLEVLSRWIDGPMERVLPTDPLLEGGVPAADYPENKGIGMATGQNLDRVGST